MNHRASLVGLTCVVALAAAAPPAGAATYYVDFDGGSDANTGLSPASPFKRCPLDPRATGAADAALIRGGDTVIFKGGVHYRGTIEVRVNTVASNPIVFDGNTAGTFGEGRAIIDGSEPVTGWTRCQSAAEADGNPHWANIWWAAIPPPNSDTFLVNLCEGDRPLSFAQDPNPSDPFYQDDIGTYRALRDPLPHDVGGYTEYADATYFTQPDGWWGDDAWIAVYARTNRVYRRRVRDYVAAEHKIVFDLLNAEQYPAGQGRFCMFNALRILDRPGEYCVKLTPEPNGMHRIFAWPYEDVGDMTISARNRGFDIFGSGITIQGFIIEKQAHAPLPSAVRCSSGSRNGIVVRDNVIRLIRMRNEPGYRCGAVEMNDVSNALVEGNEFLENSGAHAVTWDNVDDSTLSDNYIYRSGASAVVWYRCNRSAILRNTLYDNQGMHANGLTVYSGCRDVLVEGNHVSLGASPLAAQDTIGLTIINNVFDAYGSSNCISLWALHNMDDVLIACNTLVNSNHNVSWQAAIYGQSPGTGRPLTIVNNILDGLAGDLPGTIAYNCYTYSKGSALGPGEFVVSDVNQLFVDPAGRDYRLLPTAPAVDAASGTWTVGADFDGNPRPMGARADMGAFEAVELSARAGADQVVPDADGDGSQTVTLDGTASLAPYSTILMYGWSEGAAALGTGAVLDVTLAAGTHTITLTILDDRGLTSSDTVVVEVTRVLVADAGDDRTIIDADDDGVEAIALDGTGSFDPQGKLYSYYWTTGPTLLGMGATASAVLPVGTHAITLTVLTTDGRQATDTVTLTVAPPGGATAGDADGDGDVDLDDFVILKQNFGRTGNATWADGDFDADGDVDLDDFVQLKQNFGSTG
ncbi:MAG: right-handed parallel beta-helix repeat-containing protein [Planctomycetes bacterium]|nr:right-handed parallel beta-helix repeat-containing protein [Planctomycetota bacterium]